MSVALTFCDAGFSSYLPIVELLKDSPTPSRHPYALPTPRYSHRCLRVSGLHGITIKAFSVDLQFRETLASFTYFPYYLFMVWGGGAEHLASKGLWEKIKVQFCKEKNFLPTYQSLWHSLCACTCPQAMCEGVHVCVCTRVCRLCVREFSYKSGNT